MKNQVGYLNVVGKCLLNVYKLINSSKRREKEQKAKRDENLLKMKMEKIR